MARPPRSYLKDSHPELAKQVVDKTLLDTLSTGAEMKIEWECDKGHRWFAKVYNRTNAKNKTGCPVCAGKVIVEGVNDIATTDPDTVQFFVDKSLAKKYSRASNKVLTWQCGKGHIWKAPISRVVSGGARCPYCSGRNREVGKNDLATVSPFLASELVHPEMATKYSAKSGKKVDWKCSKCGYIWHASIYDRFVRGGGCPACAGYAIVPGRNDLWTVAPEYATTLVDSNVGKQIGKSSEVSVEWQCQNYEEHRWYATPGNRLKAPVDKGCPICSNHQVLVGFNDLATTNPDLVKELVDSSLATEVTAGSTLRVTWECVNGHRWQAPICRRTGDNPTGCPICSLAGISRSEQELFACIEALLLDEEIRSNVRDILPNRMELDIVIPAKHIAIEFNGVRWHSEELGNDRNYHLNKTKLSNEAGYQLIHVWEDDWNRHRAIVLRMLAAKLGVSERLHQCFPEIDVKCSERLYARKLKFCELGNRDAGIFWDSNHIQGRVTTTRNFGLVDENSVVRALIGIRSPRNNARMRRSEGEWEIQRYATYGTVIGGFTKLLKHAEQVLLSEGKVLTKWISFSANDVSDGNMYRLAGFVEDGTVPADYKYVGEKIGWYRHPKEGFQKKTFRDNPNFEWDESWTEAEAAEHNGLFRIWDAGKVRWVKPVNVTVKEAVKPDTTKVSVQVTDAVDVTVTNRLKTTSIPVRKKSEASKVTNRRKSYDMIGKRFGHWTVIDTAEDKVGVSGRSYDTWLCVCDCGTKRAVTGDSLRNGKSNSCGCIKGVKSERSFSTDITRHSTNPIDEKLCLELVNDADRKLSAKSHKKVIWKCEKGHVWEAAVASRTMGSGCPYCSGRLPVIGVNDLATTHPELAAELVNPEEAKYVGAGSGKKLQWRCTKNPEHVWYAQVKNRVGSATKKPTGCPYC